MFKKINKKMIASIILLSLILILTLSFLAVRASASRSVTLTTYYPAPYGNYNNLNVTNKVGIGWDPNTVANSKLAVGEGFIWSYGYHGNPSIGGYYYADSDGHAWESYNGSWRFKNYWNNGTGFEWYAGSGSGVAQRMVLNGAGNLGLGTAAPAAALDVRRSVDGGQLYVGRADTPTRYLSIYTGGAFPVLDAINPAYNTLQIAKNGSPQITLTTDGNLGIGTTDPTLGGRVTSMFTVLSDVTGFAIGRTNGMPCFAINPGDDYSWTMFDYYGGNWHPSIVSKGGSIGIGTGWPAAKLDVISTRISSDTQIGDFGAPGSTAGTGYVTFGNGFVGWDYGAGVLGINAHSAGGPVGGICIKRVDNGHSNVGIGTVSPSAPLSFRPATEQKIKLYDSGAGVDTYGFGVEPNELRIATSDGGFITFRNGYYNGSKMTLNSNGSLWTLSGYTQGSDIRFKKNISTINEALDKVLKLRGVIFEWKKTKDHNFTKGRHYGVIAQEIEKILPEIVITDSKGEKSVAYSEIIPVLIEAVKEQQKEIAGLKEQQKAQQKQITELKTQNKLLEQRLSALEKSIKVKRK